MPILNYTTKIESTKTIGEIQEILVRQGARKIEMDYDNDGNPISIFFTVEITPGNRVRFKLFCNHESVMKVMERDSLRNQLSISEQQRLPLMIALELLVEATSPEFSERYGFAEQRKHAVSVIKDIKCQRPRPITPFADKSTFAPSIPPASLKMDPGHEE